MHHARLLSLAVLVPNLLFAQSDTAAKPSGPKLSGLTPINGGLGGTLELADGTRSDFHIEVTATRSRLMDGRSPSGARELAIGSEGEEKLLGALEHWLQATFSPEEQREILALERLPDPRTQDQDYAHRRASLLRTVRRYGEVTRPQITKVFVGRGTIGLSLQLQLGGNAPQPLLWRSIGTEAFARLHIGTEVEPVAIDGPVESRLLLGMQNWLAKQLGSCESLWQAEPPELAEDVRLVLRAYRGYLTATSPRLRTAGVVMDGAPVGTLMFEISDAQNRVSTVRFDHAAGTTTPGRLRDGAAPDSPLVDLGSAREKDLIAVLDRTAELRRGWLGERADRDTQLGMLEKELRQYHATFLAPEAGK